MKMPANAPQNYTIIVMIVAPKFLHYFSAINTANVVAGLNMAPDTL
jgi:hypothetical protein